MIALTVLFILGAGFISAQIWWEWRNLRAAADDVDLIETSYFAQSLRATR